MEAAILAWLQELAIRAFGISLFLVLAIDGAFAIVVLATRDRTIVNRWTSLGGVPAETDESRALSRDLKKRGFSFVGPTIVYAFMQSAGLVNDHLVSCFRYAEV